MPYTLNEYTIEEEKYEYVISEIVSLIQNHNNDDTLAQECILALLQYHELENMHLLIKQTLQNKNLIDANNNIDPEANYIATYVVRIDFDTQPYNIYLENIENIQLTGENSTQIRHE